MKFATLLLNRTVVSVSRKAALVAARPAAASSKIHSMTAAASLRTTSAATCRMMSSSDGTTIHSEKELEQELKVTHDKAAHAFDSSQGDYDAPKSKQEMANLNALYHRIDALEKELATVKTLVRDARRVFAVDGPDGESDIDLKEEIKQVRGIFIDQQAASKEDPTKVEEQHKKDQKVREFHARDPEHDW